MDDRLMDEILIDELNELCENILCPTDLMETIEQYNFKHSILELKNLQINLLKKDIKSSNIIFDIIKERIKELNKNIILENLLYEEK